MGDQPDHRAGPVHRFQTAHQAGAGHHWHALGQAVITPLVHLDGVGGEVSRRRPHDPDHHGVEVGKADVDLAQEAFKKLLVGLG